MPWARRAGWAVPAVAALRAIWVQQYYRTGEHAEKVIWREPGKRASRRAELKLVSPYDLDARYCEKRGKGWENYEIHISETCCRARNPAGPASPRT